MMSLKFRDVGNGQKANWSTIETASQDFHYILWLRVCFKLI